MRVAYINKINERINLNYVIFRSLSLVRKLQKIAKKRRRGEEI